MSDYIKVTVTPTQFQVSPGESVDVEITVQNTSNLVDVFPIEIIGLDASWFRLTVSQVSLMPNGETSGILTVAPPKSSDAAAGSFPFTVKAASQRDPTQETSVECSLEIGSFYAFTMELQPQRVTGPRGSYEVSILNSGNTELRFDLAGNDPEGFCRFSFSPESPIAPPGERAVAQLLVEPQKRPLRGRPKTYSFTLTASPYPEAAGPAVAPGQLDATARLPDFISRLFRRRPHIPSAPRAPRVVSPRRFRWMLIAAGVCAVVLVVVIVGVVAATRGGGSSFQASFKPPNHLNPGRNVVFGPFELPDLEVTEVEATAKWEGAAENLSIALVRPDGTLDGPFLATRNDPTVEFVVDEKEIKLGKEGWKLTITNPSESAQASGTVRVKFVELK